MTTPSSIYNDLELRVIELQKAEYGTDAHKKLVLMLADLVDMVLPYWRHKETTPASSVRAARVFGEGRKVNWGNLTQLRTRLWTLENGYTFSATPLEHYIASACAALVSSIYQPLNAKEVLDDSMSAYIDANFGPATNSTRDYFTRYRVLFDEVYPKALEIVTRHFPQA